MVVAWPQERKVRFYASRDLKSWSHLTDFGPAGATEGIWECPDLFPLPVEGAPRETRWVLIVNLNPGGPAGGSGSQYFVGDFDGRQFVLDPGAAARRTWRRRPALAGPRTGLLRGGDVVRRPGARRAPHRARLDEQLGLRAGRAHLALAQRHDRAARADAAADARGTARVSAAGEGAGRAPPRRAEAVRRRHALRGGSLAGQAGAAAAPPGRGAHPERRDGGDALHVGPRDRSRRANLDLVRSGARPTRRRPHAVGTRGLPAHVRGAARGAAAPRRRSLPAAAPARRSRPSRSSHRTARP